MSGVDFGEHLADLAADGYDLDAPVPHRGRAQNFSRIGSENTLADGPADGARGDPATCAAPGRAARHETKSPSANSHSAPGQHAHLCQLQTTLAAIRKVAAAS